ncbi:Shr3 amino acid permease chaperone [Infundibulicybe gibba]|nr:Shr3 amino acid permease chaperone [Infundibulicybe gibba]
MGVRASVVVCVTSFLLGSLFTHWIADSLTLWKSPITDEHLWTAAAYYAILARGPAEILYFFSAVVILGGTALLWSLRDGNAGNLMFDGGSMFLFSTTVIMYLYSVLPNISAKFASIPTHHLLDPFPRALRNTTLELASSNLICSVALTGVLALQAGRFWAENAEEDDTAYGDGTEDQLSRPDTPDVKIDT